ncbi:MAG: Si-specific NAD(P)(+) transhydrogenase, partial [Planctomycetales bacterium]|nr:Si-specific NAD(P)(+) transhydrogenase [Planctomycetales bacterium]
MSDASYDYDVLVIGTGPGGEGAAMQAVKTGKRVAVIERLPEVGGACTHRGTIPSKSLRFSIFKLTELVKNPLFGASCLAVDFPDLRKSASGVISRQVDMRTNFYVRNAVPILRGHARFIDPHTVDVNGRRCSAAAVVIAVGSRPYRPPDVDFDHARVFDADTILDLKFTPKSITIYGAGVIGAEYASMFRNLGVKVNLVNTRHKLLEFLDDEISDALSYHLRDQGVIIRHQEQYERVEPLDDGVVLHLKSGKKLKTDILLWANGRTGNTDELGLDGLGLAPDSRGNLAVNACFQTEQPHIYAVGDVIGYPALASAAYMQGRAAASHIVDGEQTLPLAHIPTGIYTSPEISSVGQTERELTAASIPYEVGH